MKRALLVLMLLSLNLFGYQKWVAVVTNDVAYSDQKVISTIYLDEFKDQIKENLRKNHYISQIKYMSGRWVGIVSYPKGAKKRQVVTFSKRLSPFFKSVKQKIKAGYELKDLEYGNGRWVGIFDKSSSKKEQELFNRSKWKNIANVIKDEWRRGFGLVDIQRGASKWVALFTKPSYKDQELYTRDEYAEIIDKIVEASKRGYLLTKLEYGLGDWIAVLSKKAPYKSVQIIKADSIERFIEMLERYKRKGLYVVDLAIGF